MTRRSSPSTPSPPSNSAAETGFGTAVTAGADTSSYGNAMLPPFSVVTYKMPSSIATPSYRLSEIACVSPGSCVNVSVLSACPLRDTSCRRPEA